MPPREFIPTDPYNPEARIREFKEMVWDCTEWYPCDHDGFIIIPLCDWSNFSLTVPGYFTVINRTEVIRMPGWVMRLFRAGRWYAAISWSPGILGRGILMWMVSVST